MIPTDPGGGGIQIKSPMHTQGPESRTPSQEFISRLKADRSDCVGRRSPQIVLNSSRTLIHARRYAMTQERSGAAPNWQEQTSMSDRCQFFFLIPVSARDDLRSLRLACGLLLARVPDALSRRDRRSRRLPPMEGHGGLRRVDDRCVWPGAWCDVGNRVWHGVIPGGVHFLLAIGGNDQCGQHCPRQHCNECQYPAWADIF